MPHEYGKGDSKNTRQYDEVSGQGREDGGEEEAESGKMTDGC